MNTRLKIVILILCSLVWLAGGCASNAPAGGQTPASSSGSSSSGQSAALTPTEAPPTATVSVPTPTEVSPTATVAATTSNPLDVLGQVINSFGAIKTFRVQISKTGGTPTQMDAGLTMEIVEPDRQHAVIPGVIETIRIGTTYYLKQGANGTWRKITLPAGITPPASTGIAFDPKSMVTSAVKAQGVSFSGPDILDGKPMLTFTYTPDPTQNSKYSSGKMWVGATDGLPYQIVANGTDGSVVTVVYTYNADIQINSPIP